MHFDFVFGMLRTSAMDRVESLYFKYPHTAALGQSCNAKNSDYPQQHRHSIFYATHGAVLFFRRKKVA